MAGSIIDRYRELLHRYRGTLDLMSEVAYSKLDELILDATVYADAIADQTNSINTVVDIGSGAGLPGIVIAMRLPELQIWLIERKRRRSAFLELARTQLGLANVSIFGGEARRLQLRSRADIITAQAVSTLSQLYCSSRHLHGPTIGLLSRKGPGWQREVEALTRTLATAIPKPRTRPLGRHGTLVELRLPGGRECRSSVSSTRRAE